MRAMSEKQNYYFKAINLKSIQMSKTKNSILDAYQLQDGSEVLKDLSLINIFVGTNNSGKSRFLRTLFQASDFSCTFSGASLKKYDQILQDYLNQIRKLLADYKINTLSAYGEPQTSEQIIDQAMPFHKQFALSISQEHLPTKDHFELIQKVKKALDSGPVNQALQVFRGKGNLRYGNAQEEFNKALAATVSNFIFKLQEEEKNLPHKLNSPNRKMYIPIMRGLRKFKESESVSRSISEEYFEFVNEDHKNEFLKKSFFNGFNLYDDLSKRLLDSSVSRRRVMEYEEFLSSEFFNGVEIQISPNTEDHTIYIKIGEQSDLPIYSLGDGLQTIILVTYNGFFNQENTAFFIEEPEVYLHPGIQRTLVESILRHPNLKRHQWFFTTHSNHFLDFTLDYSQISVFNFKASQDKKFVITYMANADQTVLYNMGVKPSSVFRTNCIVWVEGITDRKYLREILHKYMNALPEGSLRFKEDLHFSFVELGGGNQVHFNLTKDNKDDLINVQWIADKSFLFIDGDNIKGDRLKNFANIAEDAKLMLAQKEIENILPEEVVKFVVSKMVGKSRNITDIKTALVNVDRISFEAFSQENVKLGEYLDTTLGLDKPYFAVPSGTINQKTEFCELAIEFMSDEFNDWSLNPACEVAAKKIYQFIKASNT